MMYETSPLFDRAGWNHNVRECACVAVRVGNVAEDLEFGAVVDRSGAFFRCKITSPRGAM